MSLKIAKAAPFEGAPSIHMPSVVGFTVSKELLYRIPVTGLRPITITVENLPEGIILEDGILRGVCNIDCEVELTVKAVNALGSSEKKSLLKIHSDCILLTPLLGFTSWNAFARSVTQEKILRTGKALLERGIADYGYSYVNLDSAWQGEYGGVHNAIMPNEKFPDMKGMCDELHALGFKCGIYSTPMRTAWGCPENMESIPGCTVGERDLRFFGVMKGIGKVHLEENNVKQWEDWGFDYLKYDWYKPDTINAELMKEALLKSNRAFAYNITVNADPEHGDYWRERTNSWRDNTDSKNTWDNLRERFETVDIWYHHVREGHFYDLDMLEIGKLYPDNSFGELTEDEVLFAYTLRAFFLSPIQISCDIDTIDDFTFDVLCNDEMIRINQDSRFDYPHVAREYEQGKAYYRRLENGDLAIAVFNKSESELRDALPLWQKMKILDVWTKESLPISDHVDFTVAPHGVRVFRLSEL